MTCQHCGANVVENASYCHACGRPFAAGAAASAPGKQAFTNTVARRGPDNDPDDPLWQGSYSKYAMIGSWLVAAAVTLGVIIAGLVAGFTASTWGWALLAAATLWIVLLLRLIYMQLSVHYTLTSQRFIHERGLLWRQQDRIETIDVDDVTVQQGPVERLVGVGTVRLTSSDRSTPEFVLSGIENVRNVAKLIDDARRAERRRRGVHIESV